LISDIIINDVSAYKRMKKVIPIKYLKKWSHLEPSHGFFDE
jgi:hypothetical protein